jgi:hypothetical protein
VEQGFQPCVKTANLKDGFQPLRYFVLSPAQGTAGAKACRLVRCYAGLKAEGLLHPVMNNPG